MKLSADGCKFNIQGMALMLLLPLSILYYECVLCLSATEEFFSVGTVCRMLFSLAYGGILCIPILLIRNIKAAKAATVTLTALCAVPFLVEYFVYRQFKVFYDVSTVVLGAGDAVGGFSRDIYQLIFCWDGLSKIVLYAFPAVAAGILIRRPVLPGKRRWIRLVIAICVAVLCYVSSLFVVGSTAVLQAAYKTEYNFQTAVQKFGLVTGVRLDLQNLSREDEDAGFELPETVPIVSTEEEVEETTAQIQPEVVYGYHKMDLNLENAEGRIKEINAYVNSLTPTRKNAYTGLFAGKNLIMITAEAFTAEVINPVRTPTLYRLATKGIQFTDYYQPNNSGTTGGEYQNVFGMLATSGGASFKNTADNYNYMTIGSQLDRLGYYGKAYHNNSYTFYSRNKTHINLGYSDGFMGYGNGMEEYVKKVWPQSDLEMFQGTLPTYIDKQPFNIYYMTVSGHSEYTRGGNTMTKRNWDAVADLDYSDQVKGYLAANMELEKAMAYLVAELESKGIADDTVICLSTDHFPYGLDTEGKFGKMKYISELYGYDVVDYFGRDHSRLILWSGCLEDEAPIVVSSPTSSLDILPTLSNLFGTQYDSRLFPGRDVLSEDEALVFNMNYDWKTDLGTYYAKNGKFVPKDENTVVPKGYVERMKTIVRNKLRYCSVVLDYDYFRYLFAPDSQ